MAPKLVFYSNQQSRHGDAVDARLVDLLPVSRGKIGYLPAAPDPDRRWFQETERHYARFGFSLHYCGVEDEFEPTQVARFADFGALHLSGGNTFRFLYWLRERGLLGDLRRYVAAGGVLIGVSAGAILMTQDIGSAAVCGDAPYPLLEGTAGLGLVDFAVLPHFEGTLAEEAALVRLAAESGKVAYGIPDGGGIVVDGADVELVGAVLKS
jgi:dipeptidase E